MKAQRVTSVWRCSVALQSISIEHLEKWGMFCTLSPPLHWVGVPSSWNIEAASREPSIPKEIWQKKHPGGDHSHLGGVVWRFLVE